MSQKGSRADVQGVHSWIRQNVLGLVAIFIALSGTALATNVASEHAAHIAKTKRGPPGPSGPPGPQGQQGIQGPVGPSTGVAGGDLTGSYPNPLIAPNKAISTTFAQRQETVALPTSQTKLLDTATSGGALADPGGPTTVFVTATLRFSNANGTSQLIDCHIQTDNNDLLSYQQPTRIEAGSPVILPV